MSKSKKPRSTGIKESSPRVNIKTASQFSGPLPPPNVLDGYEKILPGAAERIISMAEIQAAHRQKLEKLGLEENIKIIKRGQTFALIVALGMISGAVFSLYLGSQYVALAMVGTTLIGVIKWFLGKKESSAEN